MSLEETICDCECGCEESTLGGGQCPDCYYEHRWKKMTDTDHTHSALGHTIILFIIIFYIIIKYVN